MESNTHVKFVLSIGSDTSNLNLFYQFVVGDSDCTCHYKYANSEDFETCKFVVPSRVLNIISLPSCDFCFCETGSLYRIPIIKDLSKSCLVRHIRNDYILFQDKNCKAVWGCLRGSIACLSNDNSLWTLNVYIGGIPTVGAKPECKFTLPVKKKMGRRFLPVLMGFQAGNGPGKDVLHPLLFQNVFGKHVPLLNTWAILVSLGDGEIYLCTMKSENTTPVETTAQRLFCLHQPIVKINKCILGDNGEKQGLLFAGSLGKLVMFTSWEKLETFEFHVPGPVVNWSQKKGTAFHTDGCPALWKTSFTLNYSGSQVLPVLKTTKVQNDPIYGVKLHTDKEQRSRLLVCGKERSFQIIEMTDELELRVAQESGDDNTIASMGIKELLSEIHSCSEKLASLCQAQEEMKQTLNEMSCAATLALNKKVSRDFTVRLFNEWSEADPKHVKITAELQNDGNFAIVGNKWQFIVTLSTGSGRHFTRAVPLIKGLKPKEESRIVITVPFQEYRFPFSVSSGLQFYLTLSEANAKALTTEQPVDDSSNLAFFVPLNDFLVDELHFLSEWNGPGHFEFAPENIAYALLEIANGQSAAALHGIETISPRPAAQPEDTPITSYVGVETNYIEKLLREQMSSSDYLKDRLLKLLIQDSKLEVICTGGQVELGLFKQKINFTVTDYDDAFTRVTITARHPALLPKLRKAILRRLKLPYGTGTSSKALKPTAKFSLPLSTVTKCSAIQSLIRQARAQNKDETLKLIAGVYQDMRDNVTSKLHFL